MLQLFFAFMGGLLTVAAPCILPVLPIVLGSSVGRKSALRPLFIVLGFILAFALLTVAFKIFTNVLGLSQSQLRNVAIGAFVIFGLFMLWPQGFEKFAGLFSGLTTRAQAIGVGADTSARSGSFGGFLLGAMLGIVWAPCAGPILASILALVATAADKSYAALLLTAYAIGVSVPMLAIAYGGQFFTTKISWFSRYARGVQAVFGVMIIALAVAMYFQVDVALEAHLANLFPSGTSAQIENRLAASSGIQGTAQLPESPTDTNIQPSTTADGKIQFTNYGAAPEFTGIDHWLNSNPLTMKSLRGKVVLVDFWTYSCINCIRTLPYVTHLYDTYKDRGFVVIGVHSPEFDFEKDSSNVARAISNQGIHYPVAQDNLLATWQAYNNLYWPTEYLIDQKGNIVYTHSGEGNYAHTEAAIKQLLDANATAQPAANSDADATTPPDTSATLANIGSPEMYFGIARLHYLTAGQSPSEQPNNYTITTDPEINTFALSGTWQFDNEKAMLTAGSGSIKVTFHAAKVHIVAQAAAPVTLTIRGTNQPDKKITVQASQLYTIFESDSYETRTIEIIIPQSGFNAFTFTFG